MHNSNSKGDNLYNKLDPLLDSSGLSMHACQTISIFIANMINTNRQVYGTCDDGKMNPKWTKRRRKSASLLTSAEQLTNFAETRHTPTICDMNLPTLTAINIYRFNRCMSHNKDTYRFCRHRRFQWQRPWSHQKKTSSGEDRVAGCFRNCWSRTVHFRDSYYIITIYQLVNKMVCSIYIGKHYLRICLQ